MRLWHSDLIEKLDTNRLIDQHCTCCNLRGNGWGKRNRLVNFAFDDPNGEEALYWYHWQVILEMRARDIKYEPLWDNESYCGKNREARVVDALKMSLAGQRVREGLPPFAAMDAAYKEADIELLKAKGAWNG